MNKLKRFSVVLTAIVLTASFVGCGKKDDAEQLAPDPSDIETMTEPIELSLEESVDRKSALSVAECYIEAIQLGDFDFALSLLKLDCKDFINSRDLEYVLRRTKIGPYVANDTIVPPNPSFSETAGNAYYSFYTDGSYDLNKQVKIRLGYDDSNNWCVIPEVLVIPEYLVCAPKDCRFYLNGSEVSSEYITKSDTNLDYYTLPEVARRTFETKLVSSTFGEIVGEITVPEYIENSYNNNKDTYNYITREIPTELFDEVAVRVKEIYNTVYSNYDSESDVSFLEPYVSSDTSVKFFEQYYQQGMSSAIGYSYNQDDNTHEIGQIEILKIKQNPEVISYVFDENTIVLNMILDIRWINNSSGEVESEKIVSAVKMSNEGSDWKLTEIRPNAWSTFRNGYIDNEGIEVW